MRISIKGRYAIAATAYLADYYASGACVSVISIAEALGISKIYLEQIFALLKKAGIVDAVKGPQGGYILTSPPESVFAYNVLYASEAMLTEKPGPTVAEKAPALEDAIEKLVLEKMDAALREALSGVSLADIAAHAKSIAAGTEMFYI